jgi:hypothetical protein
MRKALRTAALWLIAVLAFVCVLMFLFHSRGRSVLARYKAELLAHGEKLKVSQIAIPPSTNPADIAALKLLSNGVTAVGVSPVNLMKYVAPGKARVAWRGELDEVTNYPLSASNWDELISQTEKYEPSLAVLRGVLENPPPDTGWMWRDTFQNVTTGPARTFVRDRNFCQMLFNATIVDLHQTNLDAAFANLHALAGLARLNRNEITLVSQMIRISIAQAGLSTTWEALQAPGWDEPRLAALQKDWEQVEFMDGFERSFEGERANGEILFAQVRNDFKTVKDLYKISGSPPNSNGRAAWSPAAWRAYIEENLSLFLYKLSGPDPDELFYLQWETRRIEKLRLLKQGVPGCDVIAGLTNLEQETMKRFDREKGRLRLTAIMVPSIVRATQTALHVETQRKLTITAIAIGRYQLKHIAPPADLNALVPEFLASVPIDPMSSKPICYHLKSDGTFVLYSTGEEGKDNGGDPTPAVPGTNPGLWRGRDAVWPTADAEN